MLTGTNLVRFSRYSAPLYTDMTKSVLVPDPINLQPNGEPGWKPENPAEPVQRITNVWIGKVTVITQLAPTPLDLPNSLV